MYLFTGMHKGCNAGICKRLQGAADHAKEACPLYTRYADRPPTREMQCPVPAYIFIAAVNGDSARRGSVGFCWGRLPG
jgi:hypothetical protein